MYHCCEGGVRRRASGGCFCDYLCWADRTGRSTLQLTTTSIDWILDGRAGKNVRIGISLEALHKAHSGKADGQSCTEESDDGCNASRFMANRGKMIQYAPGTKDVDGANKGKGKGQARRRRQTGGSTCTRVLIRTLYQK